MRIFFQWHCYEKKLRYVQIHFSSSNSSFEVVDNVLKLLIRGVNKNSLSASSLYFISPKLNLLYFILDCRYCESLIKYAYQLPPPPALLIPSSIPCEDSKFFLCPTLLTRQQNFFLFSFLIPICHSSSRNSTAQNFMK